MAEFLGQDFLLQGETARSLYHSWAKDMPIMDYHCHVSAKEIFEDRHFANIGEAWLEGDHYKWRLMRANGIDEEYITGHAPMREKFQKFAQTLPRAIGNPMIHWCHMELRRYLGYEGILNGETAQEVWELSEKILARPDRGVRGLIRMSNVRFIGTTDDPIDPLTWHKQLSTDDSFSPVVAPSFRPDKALNIEKATWCSYIHEMECICGSSITSLSALEDALYARMLFFKEHGCRASDHGLDAMVCRDAKPDKADAILKKALAGGCVSAEEAEIFKTTLLRFCATKYAQLGWVMQIHYNALRNPNTAMFSRIGSDTGFDSISPNNGIASLSHFLDGQYAEGTLPRTVLYSLDANDNTAIDALIGAFQGSDFPGKLQHGSAWWFNDTKPGMIAQMQSLASLGILGNFIGMLTDSRSFLSYTRHEYFRRILCNCIGEWIDKGEYPAQEAFVGQMIQDICYNNASRYFRTEEDSTCV